MLKCPTHCPVSGVNIMHFILCLIFGFGFIFAFDYVLHGILLIDAYHATPERWRSEEDMWNHFPFTLLVEGLIVFITLFIFTRNFEGKGIGEGLRFGVMIGLLIGVLMMAPYGWLPVSPELALSWFFGGLLQGIGLGVVYSIVYKK